jgi:hypothetical protein
VARTCGAPVGGWRCGAQRRAHGACDAWRGAAPEGRRVWGTGVGASGCMGWHGGPDAEATQAPRGDERGRDAQERGVPATPPFSIDLALFDRLKPQKHE